MRNRTVWLALLVTAGLALAPRAARAQQPDTGGEVPPPPVLIPTPLGHPRYEEGGLYLAGQFKFFQQTNTMGEQLIASHGFIDRDASIGNALGIGGTPGQFIGDHSPALDTEQLGGPSTFTPGYEFTLGWRFRSGIAIEFNWLHLVDARYSATASFQPGTGPGEFQENTFVTAPVFNYPTNYFGPANQVGIGNLGATSGIWNASNLMTIDFVQRFDMWEINVRYPLTQSDCLRTYGLFGPRLVALWERFRWITSAADVNGLVLATDTATYSNVVSNRLWGIFIGYGAEYNCAVTPIGAFAVSADAQVALFADFINAQAKYELGDLSTAASRKRRLWTLAPELAANLSVWWYPYEAIQFRLSYDAMAFFNTVSSPKPVDFNYGAIAPAWEEGTFRLLNGISIGMAVVF